MPLRRSTSCEFTSFCHGSEYLPERLDKRSRSARKKSVQWSSDLEEVRYFIPHRSRSESIKRRFKKVKQMAEQLTDRPLRVLPSIGEARVKRLRMIGRQANCFSLDSGLQSFEEYNKQWDLLFELHSARERRDRGIESTEKGETASIVRAASCGRLRCLSCGACVRVEATNHFGENENLSGSQPATDLTSSQSSRSQ